MILLKEITKDTVSKGINCDVEVRRNGSQGLGIDIRNKTNPNLYGCKVDIPNLYYHMAMSLANRFDCVLVGETDTEYIILRCSNSNPDIFSTPKDNFSMNSIETISIDNNADDFIVKLEDIGNEYSIIIEIGNCYDYRGGFSKREYTFNTKLPIENKVLGFMGIMKDFAHTESISPIHYAVKEDEIGMKIDTTLDQEPLYFCDGDKKKLIITEDMIVRGNTNFNDNQLKYEGKNILCDDNLV